MRLQRIVCHCRLRSSTTRIWTGTSAGDGRQPPWPNRAIPPAGTRFLHRSRCDPFPARTDVSEQFSTDELGTWIITMHSQPHPDSDGSEDVFVAKPRRDNRSSSLANDLPGGQPDDNRHAHQRRQAAQEEPVLETLRFTEETSDQLQIRGASLMVQPSADLIEEILCLHLAGVRCKSSSAVRRFRAATLWPFPIRAVRMSTFSDSLWSRAADVCSFGEHLFTTSLPGGFGLPDFGSPRGPESRCRYRGTVLTSAPGVGGRLRHAHDYTRCMSSISVSPDRSRRALPRQATISFL